MIWQPSNTPEDVLMHYAKGSRAKKHKYTAIKNGRYIYPEDKTDAYKDAQRKASKHDIHIEGKAGDHDYIYKYRTKSPGTSHNKLIVPYGTTNSATETEDPNVKRRKVENPSHMRSDIERWDYFAGAAAKYDSTKKRMATAKSLAREAEESLARYPEESQLDNDRKKWETVAKSASIREKQKKEYAEKQKNEAVNKKTSASYKLSTSTASKVQKANRSPVVIRTNNERRIAKGKSLFNKLKTKITNKISSTINKAKTRTVHDYDGTGKDKKVRRK